MKLFLLKVSSLNHFNNDDNNLATLKGNKRITLAIFGFGGRRANRWAILPCCSF